MARLLAAWEGTEHASVKDKGKGTPSPTTSLCRPAALDVRMMDEPRRSPRTQDLGPERSPSTRSNSAKP